MMGNRKWGCQRLHHIHPKCKGVTLVCLLTFSFPLYPLFFVLLHYVLSFLFSHLFIILHQLQTKSSFHFISLFSPSFPSLHPLQEVFRLLYIRHVPADSSFLHRPSPIRWSRLLCPVTHTSGHIHTQRRNEILQGNS